LFFDEPSAGSIPLGLRARSTDPHVEPRPGIDRVVTHELPSIFLVADSCIVLDKVAKGIVARGNPREVRDQANNPFVHAFFTRSSPGTVAHHGVS
jgi:phospholipid/cholesterol/gamma-HCH transport system ATP-binding protein